MALLGVAQVAFRLSALEGVAEAVMLCSVLGLARVRVCGLGQETRKKSMCQPVAES